MVSPGNKCVERLPMAADTTKVIFPKRELTKKRGKKKSEDVFIKNIRFYVKMIKLRLNGIFGHQPFIFVSRSSLYFDMFQKGSYCHPMVEKC